MAAFKPLTVIVPDVAWLMLPVRPPGVDVAVYDRIAAPPLRVGAVKATVALVELVLVASSEVGAPGTVASVVTELEAADAAEVPEVFVPVTVNVYAVPGDNPFTVIVPLPGPARVPIKLPGLEVAV